MNFKDEYKKAINELSPDEPSAERIREGVMKRLAAQSAQPEAPVKKPLPIKRIAVIGGSVAACLVIGITAMVTAGSRKINANFSGGMAGDGVAAPGINGIGKEEETLPGDGAADANQSYSINST